MQIDLSQYPLFANAKEVKPILLPEQGCSNKNYLLSHHKKKYLLRYFILQDRDRALEYSIQTLAYKKGIAAKPLLLDLDENLMVCEFLEGEHKAILERKDIATIISVLKKLHSIKSESKALELSSLFTAFSAEVKDAFSVILKYPKQMVLCHNDLNPKNILFGKNDVKLIDWEFAANNDLYFDLAALSVEFNLSVIDEAYMLAFYFQREGWEKEKVEAYKVIYKALCKQWFKENP